MDFNIIYSNILERRKKRNKTNCYLSDIELEELIFRDDTKIQIFDDGVYVLAKEKDCIRLYYFLENDIKPLQESDLPIIIEEVFLEGVGSLFTDDDWAGVYAKPYVIRKRLYKKANTELLRTAFEIAEGAIRFAKLSDLEYIYNLLKESFEPYTSLIPVKEELKRDVLENRIYIKVNNCELQGFLRFSVEGKISNLLQVAISPEFKNQGIGFALVSKWLSKAEFNIFRLWVRVDNESAVKMYEKLGFLSDNRLAKVMIKKER